MSTAKKGKSSEAAPKGKTPQEKKGKKSSPPKPANLAVVAGGDAPTEKPIDEADCTLMPGYVRQTKATAESEDEEEEHQSSGDQNAAGADDGGDADDDEVVIEESSSEDDEDGAGDEGDEDGRENNDNNEDDDDEEDGEDEDEDEDDDEESLPPRGTEGPPGPTFESAVGIVTTKKKSRVSKSDPTQTELFSDDDDIPEPDYNR